MAYRRKQGNARFPDIWPPPPPPTGDDPQSSPPSIAAQAIRASSAHRDSSLSSVYGESAFSAARRNPNHQTRSASDGDAKGYEYTSIKNLSESKGFWNVLAQKAKNILELEKAARQRENPDRNRTPNFDMPADSQSPQSQLLSEDPAKVGNPKLQKGLDKITSSLNYIGEKVGSRLEEGISIVETRTANIIQETRKLNIRRKGSGSNAQAWVEDASGQHIAPQSRMNLEIQLKAARDVANAMAAKAKMYMRELKTVKADLAFAKERCTQLEEENKLLRESNEKGGHPEDDDLIRLQLETLLAEKGRLTHENSVYARENRFLREIVEYHQLTMQDVVYLDEGIEQVTEVYPTQSPTLSYSPGASALHSSLSHTPSLDDPDFHASMPPTSPSISSLGEANPWSNNLFGYGNSLAPTNPLPYNLFVHGNSPVFPVPPMQMLEEKQTREGGT